VKAIEQQYTLISKFKCGTPDNKLQLKIQFDIENCGISEIGISPESNNPSNNGTIKQSMRNLKSGEILLREKD